SGPDWMFDLDFLTNTMNYIPVSVENQDSEDVAKEEEEHKLTEADQALKDDLERMIAQEIAGKAIDDVTRQAFEEEKNRAAQVTSINNLNTGRPSVGASNSPLGSTANTSYASAASTPTEDDSNVFPNDDIFSGAYNDEDMGAEADFNNIDNTIDVSPIPRLRVHKDHPKGQILGDPKSAVQTRGKIQRFFVNMLWLGGRNFSIIGLFLKSVMLVKVECLLFVVEDGNGELSESENHLQ
ncbi:hypothetical protein Tco_0210586, partial [Tanacetum coccineum]